MKNIKKLVLILPMAFSAISYGAGFDINSARKVTLSDIQEYYERKAEQESTVAIDNEDEKTTQAEIVSKSEQKILPITAGSSLNDCIGKKGIVRTEYLNYYTEPWGNVIGQFAKDIEVTITGVAGNWFAIDMGGGNVYVQAKWLDVEDFKRDFPDDGTVSEDVKVYDADGTVIGELEAGEDVEIIADNGTYWKIVFNNQEGYVVKVNIDTIDDDEPENNDSDNSDNDSDEEGEEVPAANDETENENESSSDSTRLATATGVETNISVSTDTNTSTSINTAIDKDTSTKTTSNISNTNNNNLTGSATSTTTSTSITNGNTTTTIVTTTVYDGDTVRTSTNTTTRTAVSTNTSTNTNVSNNNNKTKTENKIATKTSVNTSTKTSTNESKTKNITDTSGNNQYISGLGSLLSPGKVTTKVFKQQSIGSKWDESGIDYTHVQGICCDGTYFYIALLTSAHNKDYTNQYTKILKMDMSSKKIVKAKRIGKIGHSNSLCYNTKTNKIYSATCTSKMSYWCEIDTNLSGYKKVYPKDKNGKKYTNKGFASFTYDPNKNQYVVKMSNKSFGFFDQDFELIKTVSAGQNMKVNDSMTGQAIYCDGKNIFSQCTNFNVKPSVNYIQCYDMNGKYIQKITLKGFGELEQLTGWKGKYYTISNHNGFTMHTIKLRN